MRIEVPKECARIGTNPLKETDTCSSTCADKDGNYELEDVSEVAGKMSLARRHRYGIGEERCSYFR